MAFKRTGILQLGGHDATVIGDDVMAWDTLQDFKVHVIDWTSCGIMPTMGDEPDYDEVL